MAKKHSYEYVKEYIESYGYILLSKEYINASKPLSIKCKEGHIFEISFNHFQQYKIERCPYCNGSRFTYEYIKEYIESYGYILLSKEYINANEKIKIMCDKGHIYKASFSQFKYQEQRCPHCSGSVKFTYEYVKEYIESYGYILLSKEYINCKTHLLVKCPCGNRYNVTFSNFKRGRRCNECNKAKWNEDTIKKYIKNNTKYTFVRFIKFDRGNSIIELICEKGHLFSTKFFYIKRGTGCPICRTSKGENKIKDVLSNFKINYIWQHRFEDCKFKNSLPFDFYLPQKNICIEFDGELHYKSIDFFGGYEKLLENKRNDTIKNIYCQDNNIKLIRIPYWDFDNMENILIKELDL